MNVFEQFLEIYGPNTGEDAPVRFAEEVLGIDTLDGWQEDSLRDVGRGERRIAIAACHEAGSSRW